ncbi:acetate--CoA ligase family protein [Desulfobotulus sp. H1]|uniref:Acetate--CoA ligase family protein n=1 Tax=Desulfobotulus pelophilus TaxID=2823377 RepID=A0ABT3N5V7_9BACT|nr:acetate--CoA ligase family protein [Desulfobotulus pelophilus]MCW7752839.1 acetate--CoA ligase family protein [Desulfobotulus pelophilus]
METMFNPQSLVIFGLSAKQDNVPRLILENLLRWGYRGRILGVHPGGKETQVAGITMYQDVEELPIVPDLAVLLIPARFVPDMVKNCGRFGIRRMALLSGGFNELGEEGELLASRAVAHAKEYDVRFIGPNCLALANTRSGLCLPFVPIHKPPTGGFSMISQSGGLGIFHWNHLKNENVGLAKFASIGNKLDVSEVEVLEYLGKDPDTRIIGMYLESVTEGRALVEAAKKIDKPILIYKASVTQAGQQAAMSHTAALASDEGVMDSACKEAGIIRLHRFEDFIDVSKAFELPPLRGNRLMVMSPIGGGCVMMADNCENNGFVMADPGTAFYEDMQKKGNAGIIQFSNPLDLGDVYDMNHYASIFHGVMHSDGVDGAVYLSQWPDMPKTGEKDVFTKLFQTDVSREAIGAVRSSGKPLGAVLWGRSSTLDTIKQNLGYPLFNTPEGMIYGLAMQRDFYAKRLALAGEGNRPSAFCTNEVKKLIGQHTGDVGEDFLDVLSSHGIRVPESRMAVSEDEAVAVAEAMGYPVVLKVVSPDALHKSDVGGVKVGLRDGAAVARAHGEIRDALKKHLPLARFEGVRVVAMAQEGHDMFVGASQDPSFGPVVFFGYGGVFVEIFKDVDSLICPTTPEKVEDRLFALKSYALLEGARGGMKVDTRAFCQLVAKVSLLVAAHAEVVELDLNPVRIFKDGSVMTLDARARVVR